MITIAEENYWIQYINDNILKNYGSSHDFSNNPKFPSIPLEVLKNYNVALHLIFKGNEKLFNLPTELINDKKFIQLLISKKTGAGHYCHFPISIKTDPDIIESCYILYPSILQYVPREVKTIEFINHLLSVNGMGLEFCYDPIKNNKESCLIALNNNSKAIQFVSKKIIPELCHDSKLVYTILHNFAEGFQYLSHKIKNNIQYSSLAILNHPDNLEFASNKIKNNKKMVLEFIELFNAKSFHASKELQFDYDIQLKQIEQNDYYFKFFPYALQQDVNFILKAMCIQPNIYAQLTNNHKNDSTVILKLLEITGDKGVSLLPPNIKKEIGNNNPLYYIQQKILRTTLQEDLIEHKPLKKLKL